MDETLGLIAGSVSPAVAEKISLIAALDPFMKGVDILRRLTGIEVSASCMEDVSRRIGGIICTDERKQSEELCENPQNQKVHESAPKRLYIEADGAMINTVKDGWKENKLAMVFSEDDIKRTGEGEKERISIQKKNFVTSLAEGVETFRKLVRLMGWRAGAFAAHELILISDGATWLINMLKELFPNGVHILDWYHVTENLWKCSHALFGEGGTQGTLWVTKYKNIIWEGGVKEALEMLLQEAAVAKNQTPLRSLYSYFDYRKESMKYAEFRNKGYYIGSGSIESANGYAIQDRLKKAGMKWSIGGANAIAHLRIKYLSNNWDYIWRKGSPIFEAA